MIGRLPGWEVRLNALFGEYRNAPYAWGKNDCVSFACLSIHALIEVDPIAIYRGKYSTEEEAQKHLADFGAGFVSQMKSLFSAFKCIPVERAQRGDVVLLRDENVVAVGVYNSGLLWAPASNGLKSVPLNRGLRAWGIGHE